MYLGFEKPSAIQQRAILPIVKGRDVIETEMYQSNHQFHILLGLMIIYDYEFVETN